MALGWLQVARSGQLGYVRFLGGYKWLGFFTSGLQKKLELSTKNC